MKNIRNFFAKLMFFNVKYVSWWKYIWCIKSAIYLLPYVFQLVLEPYAPHYRVDTSFLGAHTTIMISDRTDNSHSKSTSDYMHPMKDGNYENVRHRSPKIMLMLGKNEVL